MSFRKLQFAWASLGLVLLVFSLSAFQVKAQSTPPSPVPLPVPFTPIVDNAHVIDDQTRTRLEQIYRDLKERGNIEYSVLTVDTTGDQDIFDFSLAVARGWGIGSSQDDEKAGLLLVVAIQDRKYFTQVSRHIEGDLPDGLVGQIQRERLVPQFKQRNYSKGILDTIEAYAATLGAKRGFSVEGIGESKVYRGVEERPRRPPQASISTVCGILIVILVIVVLLSSASRRRGGGGSGCLQALLWGSLFSNLSGGGRSSGWGGGGFGGGGFGGGGGGGGFGGGFGGGGDFGGGGSGGSW